MSGPHVAFNALWLDPERSGGTETYLRGLVPALLRCRPEARVTVVTTRRGAAALRADGWAEWCAVVEQPTDEGERRQRLHHELIVLPRLARKLGCDLLHSPASMGPPASPIPHVVTIHDLTFERFRTLSLRSTVAMRVLVRLAARSASVVLTGSRASKDEVVGGLRLNPARVLVVPHGAGRPTGVEPGDLPAGVPDDARVVLCVAALRPHKNQELLVRALPHLPRDVVLVLAGTHEPYARRVRALADEMGVGDRVLLPGYLTDAEVEALWRAAACAALPTRAEGFGLPVLEAMARGVAVACSDIPVLREVAGDAAHWFPTDGPVAAARAIRAAMDDDGARGRIRAAAYTWDRAAAGTWEGYDLALAAPGRARRR